MRSRKNYADWSYQARTNRVKIVGCPNAENRAAAPRRDGIENARHGRSRSELLHEGHGGQTFAAGSRRSGQYPLGHPLNPAPPLPGSVAGSAVRPHQLRPPAPPPADPFRKVRHLCLTSPGLFFSSRRVEKNSPGLFVNTSPTMILPLPAASFSACPHSLHHAPAPIFAPAFQKVRKRFGRNRRLAYLCTRKNAQGGRNLRK